MSEGIIVPIVIFGSAWAIIKLVLDHKIRRHLIEKGADSEALKGVVAREARMQRLSSLKWGMVLIGLGAALLIGFFWPYSFTEDGVLGLMLLFAGIAFLAYFAIAHKGDQYPPQD